MSLVYLITHPDVVIDPDVPAPQWPLSARGKERMKKMMMDLEQKIAIVLLLFLSTLCYADAASKTPECVVLLHGLARSEKSLLKNDWPFRCFP
jgi:hypothetical protein